MKLRNSPIKGRPQSILLQLITVAYTGHPRLETHELLRFKSINTAMNEYTVPFRSDRSCDVGTVHRAAYILINIHLIFD